MNTILAKAKENLANSLPFVLYKKPRNTTFKGVFQRDNELHFVKDFKRKGFVFAPFNKDKPSVLIPPDYVLEDAIHDNEIEITLAHNPVVEDQKERQAYQTLVAKAIETIKANDFKKVVLSRRVEVPFEGDSINLFLKLIHTYDNAFCYLWYHPKVGLWLGATPEILVKRRGIHFTTMSLAGTQAVNNKLTKPVWSSKELEEQQLVTDYIKECLETSAKNLQIAELESVRAGKLWHLRTKISGQMQKDDFGALTNSLHPTPAVCGLPLASSKEFIRNYEGYNRSFYTGYLGELNFKEERSRNPNRGNTENNAYKTVITRSEFYVNLRCMQLKENKAIVYVGGGITKESDPAKEWEETVVKSHTMLNMI